MCLVCPLYVVNSIFGISGKFFPSCGKFSIFHLKVDKFSEFFGRVYLLKLAY